MKKIKVLLFIFMAFVIGFFTHAFFFPDFLPNGLQDIAASNFLLPAQNKSNIQTDSFITYVNYDGNQFIPQHVTILKGNYLAITNTSKDKLMWLSSDNDLLNMERGYAQSERLQVLLPKVGEYTVVNKLNTQAQLSVKVK